MTTAALDGEQAVSLARQRRRERFVNFLTGSRCASGVLIGLLGLCGVPILGNWYVTVWIALAFLTDFEGRLAHKWGVATPRGAEFDPIADGTLFTGIGIAVLRAKELTLETAFAYHFPSLGLIVYACLTGWRRRRGKIPQTSQLAKTIVTVVAIAIVASFSYHAFALPYAIEQIGIACLWSAFILTWIAYPSYLFAYRRSLAASADR